MSDLQNSKGFFWFVFFIFGLQSGRIALSLTEIGKGMGGIYIMG